MTQVRTSATTSTPQLTTQLSNSMPAAQIPRAPIDTDNTPIRKLLWKTLSNCNSFHLSSHDCGRNYRWGNTLFPVWFSLYVCVLHDIMRPQCNCIFLQRNLKPVNITTLLNSDGGACDERKSFCNPFSEKMYPQPHHHLHPQRSRIFVQHAWLFVIRDALACPRSRATIVAISLGAISEARLAVTHVSIVSWRRTLATDHQPLCTCKQLHGNDVPRRIRSQCTHFMRVHIVRLWPWMQQAYRRRPKWSHNAHTGHRHCDVAVAELNRYCLIDCQCGARGVEDFGILNYLWV